MLDIEGIREKLSEETCARAGEILSSVREARRSRSEAIYTCTDEGRRHTVRFDLSAVRCDCGRDDCVHIAAALMEAAAGGALEELERTAARENALALTEVTRRILPETEEVTLELTLAIQGGRLRAGLRSGVERLYVVRSVPLFIEAIEKQEVYSFGKGFDLDPRFMRFDPEMTAVLDILADQCESLTSVTGADARLMPLSRRTACRLLSQLSAGTPFRLMTEQNIYSLRGVEQGAMPMDIVLSGAQESLQFTVHYPYPILPLTGDCRYIFAGGKVWHIEEACRGLVALICEKGAHGTFTAVYSQQDTAHVLRDLLPYLMCTCAVTIDPALSARLVRVPLKPSVYLDKSGRDVTAGVRFTYGDLVLDPFVPETQTDTGLLLRDTEGERRVLDELARSGFRVRHGGAYLHGTERVYDFLSDGVNRLLELCEVFLSNDFRLMRPRKLVLQGAMMVSGGKLHLDMLESQTPLEELVPLMEAIRARKKYFRFREGNFIDLSDAGQWVDFADAIVQSVGLGETETALYRAAYFDALIRRDGLPVTEDEETRRVARMEAETNEPPLDCLRPYQVRGYHWLRTLCQLRMGGVLADEMGLGKTLQTISALLDAKRGEQEYLPSLIIAPTSLTYNWLSEIKRFAPELTACVVEGTQAARANTLDHLSFSCPDVVITSYPLIRRDIDRMRQIDFRYAVLDEAQNIKNIRSVGARAVKQLSARCRVALTGTPMENHPGELWSLFDFVLPGYLPPYPEFLRRFSEGQNAEDLLFRTRPFMMRRLKKDVLKDLPPLLDSIQKAYMPPEQRRAYDAALLQSRQRVRDLVESGRGRDGMEILSVLTLLRQMCCHPALCLPEYKGASGKTDMLMDILSSALAAGRRVLVFSQFTSMLRLIEPRLEEEKMPYFYLDGSTPAEERLRLADAFNAGERSVFLVSLKAGGTGLNLTGADLVIHYDPWWNPAAEDQATGRAHRIGQTRTVEVIRLIVHDSIEEQVL